MGAAWERECVDHAKRKRRDGPQESAIDNCDLRRLRTRPDRLRLGGGSGGQRRREALDHHRNAPHLCGRLLQQSRPDLHRHRGRAKPGHHYRRGKERGPGQSADRRYRRIAQPRSRLHRRWLAGLAGQLHDARTEIGHADLLRKNVHPVRTWHRLARLDTSRAGRRQRQFRRQFVSRRLPGGVRGARRWRRGRGPNLHRLGLGHDRLGSRPRRSQQRRGGRSSLRHPVADGPDSTTSGQKT